MVRKIVPQEEDDTVMEGYHGEAAFDVENSSLFSVVEHQGQKDLRFICLQGNRFVLFHKGACRSALLYFVNLTGRAH